MLSDSLSFSWQTNLSDIWKIHHFLTKMKKSNTVLNCTIYTSLLQGLQVCKPPMGGNRYGADKDFCYDTRFWKFCYFYMFWQNWKTTWRCLHSCTIWTSLLQGLTNLWCMITEIGQEIVHGRTDRQTKRRTNGETEMAIAIAVHPKWLKNYVCTLMLCQLPNLKIIVWPCIYGKIFYFNSTRLQYIAKLSDGHYSYTVLLVQLFFSVNFWKYSLISSARQTSQYRTVIDNTKYWMLYLQYQTIPNRRINM